MPTKVDAGVEGIVYFSLTEEEAIAILKRAVAVRERTKRARYHADRMREWASHYDRRANSAEAEAMSIVQRTLAGKPVSKGDLIDVERYTAEAEKAEEEKPDDGTEGK